MPVLTNIYTKLANNFSLLTPPLHFELLTIPTLFHMLRFPNKTIKGSINVKMKQKCLLEATRKQARLKVDQ